jgi:signal peptidase
MVRKIVKEAVIILTIIAFLSPVFVCPVVALFIGGHFSVIMSGSMEPAIPVGSIVIIKKVNPEDVKVGDIIAFKGSESTILHRVIDKVVEGGSFYFRTKGDANEDPDPWIVKPEDICGALMLRIPYYGYFIHFAGTPIGLTLFILVPTIILFLRKSFFRINRHVSPFSNHLNYVAAFRQGYVCAGIWQCFSRVYENIRVISFVKCYIIHP